MAVNHRAGLTLGLFVAALSICSFAQRANAQVLYGSVVGSVTDQSAAVIPGARVTLTNPLTGLARETDTDASGLYTIPNLPEGVYELTVSAQGFKPLRQSNVIVRVGSVVRQDVALQVGAIAEEVTVTASAAVLQTETVDVSTKLGTVAVQNLPLGFYRNFQMLMTLAPGAGAPCEGCTGSIVDTPERAVEIHFNGLRSGANTTRIDGAVSPFLWKPEGGTLYVPPAEAIQEVNVVTSNYAPEKGMAGAASVDVVTKSGTNNFHGIAHWYHFNQHLLACSTFDVVCKDKTQNKPKQLMNVFGGNIGGPIKKNKLFFFVNWEGTFQRSNFGDFATLPNSDERAGDFSSFLGAPVYTLDANGNTIPLLVPTTDGNGVIGPLVQAQQAMVFDPTTGNADGTGRAVFAAGTTATTVGQLNALPGNRFWPGVVDMLGFLPDANVPGQDIGGFLERNYFLSENQRFNRNNYDIKVDLSRTDTHLIWAKYSAMDALVNANCGFNKTAGGPCAEPWGDSGDHHDLVQVATVGHTWTVSPTFVVDGSVGYSRMGIAGFPQDWGGNVGIEILKVPGTNDPNDIRTSGTPGLSITGYGGGTTCSSGSCGPILFGSAQTWNPYFRNDWSLTNSHNASWIKGKHNIRFGFDGVHHHLNHWQPESGFGPPGGFTFYYGNTTFLNTGNLDIVDATGADSTFFAQRYNAFASFLLGLYDFGGRSVQFQKMNAKESTYAFHFSDQWRATPKLTLNLGLRWEYYPVFARDSLGKGLEQYNPETNTVILGGIGSNPKTLGVTTSKKLFAPRVGLAYQINPQTVFRGGYGVTFDPYPIVRVLRASYPAEISTLYWGDDTYQPIGSFFDPDGLVLPDLPDVSSGEIEVPSAVSTRFAPPGLLKRGVIQSWNVTVERKLPGDLLVHVGYVGNRMYNGWGFFDMQASPIGVEPELRQRWGRTGDTDRLQGFDESHYNSLQVMVDRHFEKGLYLRLAYTYSKAIDMFNQGSGWEGPIFGWPEYWEHNRGMSNQDRRHVFRAAYVWDLPFGENRKWANSNRVGRAIVGGWQLNGIVSFWTGVPLTLTQTSEAFLPGRGNSQTVDQVGAFTNLGNLGPGEQYYDPSAFKFVEEARFGTTGRNVAVYGPGHGQIDASLFRHIKLTEKFNLQFRAESLNLTNTPKWNNPSTDCGKGSIDPITRICGGSFLQVDSVDPASRRIIRFGLRLQW